MILVDVNIFNIKLLTESIILFITLLHQHALHFFEIFFYKNIYNIIKQSDYFSSEIDWASVLKRKQEV